MATPPICDFGWKAPSFSLPATDGKTYSLTDIAGPKGALIAFIVYMVRRFQGEFEEALPTEPVVLEAAKLLVPSKRVWLFSLGLGTVAGPSTVIWSATSRTERQLTCWPEGQEK